MKKGTKLNRQSQRYGQTKERLYKIYRDMKSRCYNLNDYHYEWYGKRGIKICNEWLEDYINFKNWSMENGYQEDLKIDRINNDGNYEPSNCRWTTHKEQCNNRRNNILITINNETKTLTQWIEFYKDSHLDKNIVKRRMEKGIKGEDLFKPLKNHPHHNGIYQLNLEGDVIREWNSFADIHRELNYSINNILKVCKHKKGFKTAYGYKWEYKND